MQELLILRQNINSVALNFVLLVSYLAGIGRRVRSDFESAPHLLRTIKDL